MCWHPRPEEVGKALGLQTKSADEQRVHNHKTAALFSFLSFFLFFFFFFLTVTRMTQPWLNPRPLALDAVSSTTRPSKQFVEATLYLYITSSSRHVTILPAVGMWRYCQQLACDDTASSWHVTILPAVGMWPLPAVTPPYNLPLACHRQNDSRLLLSGEWVLIDGSLRLAKTARYCIVWQSWHVYNTMSPMHGIARTHALQACAWERERETERERERERVFVHVSVCVCVF